MARWIAGTLILMFLTPPNYFLQHSHAESDRAASVEHALHPHIHTHSHHHHGPENGSGDKNQSEHEHSHDAPEIPLEDHDSDVVYVVTADMAPHVQQLPHWLTDLTFYGVIGTTDLNCRAIPGNAPTFRGVHGPPEAGCCCPVYLRTLSIRC